MAGMTIVALLCLAQTNPIVDRVSLIEINHYCNVVDKDTWQYVNTAIVFWDCHMELKDGQIQKEWRVCDWRFLNVTGPPIKESWPKLPHAFEWHENGIKRRVESMKLNETITPYDSEHENKKVWPSEKRRKLTDPKKKVQVII